MSIQAFSALTSEETEQLLRAPAMVTLLIAGADEQIDKREENWATKLVRYRTFTAEAELQAYYEMVDQRFEQQLSTLIAEWEAGDSTKVAAQLAETKPVLAKLDTRYAKLLKQSWRTLAKKVAKASGGLVGFGAVDSEERKVVDLPMLD
jgi:hypothetical protein